MPRKKLSQLDRLTTLAPAADLIPVVDVSEGKTKTVTANELINGATKPYGVATGTANALVVTIADGPAALVAGLGIYVKAASNNSDAATLNLNGTGAKAVIAFGAALEGDEIQTGVVHLFVYDGTSWHLSNPVV